MQKFTSILVSAAVLISLPGCQSLSRGKTQHVPATSRPAGVRVIVDGKDAGSTPVNLKLLRRDVHVVRFELDGYRPVEVRISKKRPSVGETILTSAVWVPIGGIVLGVPIYFIWRAAAGPSGEDFKELGRAFYSFLIGAAVAWAGGTIIDGASPNNFDLDPRTIFVEMEKADGSKDQVPAVVWLNADELQRLNWIRIAVR